MKIGAIVLAAGGSSRFAVGSPSARRPKQLLTYEGMTFVRRAARAALGARGPVVIVVGREQEEIAHELLGLPVTIVPNDRWERGLGGSLRCGLAALLPCDAIVILVCDQPRVDEAVIRRLIAEHERTGDAIVACAYAGTLGVPALFGRGLFKELRALPDEQGAKSIILRHRDRVATIDFPAGAFDIDTPDDYRRLERASQPSP